MITHRRAWLIMLLICLCGLATAAHADDVQLVCTFKNPLLLRGQDPSVVYEDGFYYLVQSNNATYSIELLRAETLSGLGSAQPVTIWAAPPNTAYSRDIWAPELLSLRGGWYIYFAADDGNNNNHRTYVLQASSDDLMGAWAFKGPLFRTPELDKWSIDFSAFEYKDQLYGVWSGSAGEISGAAFPQVLYLAAMSDPLTIEGKRVEIVVPTEPYETSIAAIAEGPEPYVYEDTVSIVYSANASWTRHYNLALVTLTGDNPLDASAWVKKGSIFAEVEGDQGAVYGVGHNSLPVLSPDGKEWWQVYHAKTLSADGWDDRDIRAQRMTWAADGTPDFGTPIPSSVAQAVPAGEACGLQATFSFDSTLADDAGTAVTVVGDPVLAPVSEGSSDQAVTMNGDDVLDVGRPLISTTGSYTLSARVMLPETAGDYTLMSQEGGLFSAFRIHTTEDGHLAFTAYNQRGQIAADAISSESLNSNSWYTVTAVRDALAGEITLYIDGTQAASAPFNDDWLSLKSFVLGASKEKGKRQHYFVGMLDDVRVYNGAAAAEDVKALNP